MPFTNKWTFGAFNSAHTTLRAEYLVQRYLSSFSQNRNKGLIGFALSFPLCTKEVLSNLALHPLNATSFSPPLPKRFFKNLTPRKGGKEWSESDDPLPFLKYIYSHARSSDARFRPPDVNANEGYALCRAVHAGFYPLVTFLLSQGASLAYKDALAVRIAIRKLDADLVRTLLERDVEESVIEVECQRSDSNSRNYSQSRIQASNAPVSSNGTANLPIKRQKIKKSGKRRRLEDRIEVTTAMLRLAVKADARDIVELFLSKGARPDMATLDLMRGSGLV